MTVHGKEYGFGAHDFPASGVFEVEPRSCPGFIYRNSIVLGRINKSPSEFRSFIENIASEYHGDTYHLISKNCNHFTDDICWRLTGKRVPGWVNRLARLGMYNFLSRSFSILVHQIWCFLRTKSKFLLFENYSSTKFACGIKLSAFERQNLSFLFFSSHSSASSFCMHFRDKIQI